MKVELKNNLTLKPQDLNVLGELIEWNLRKKRKIYVQFPSKLYLLSQKKTVTRVVNMIVIIFIVFNIKYGKFYCFNKYL